jgi:hypothetical protein
MTANDHSTHNRPASLIKPAILLFTLIAAIFLSGCIKQTHSGKPSGKTVFLNSFETPKDTVQWYWYGEHRLIADAPPGGGRYALEVSGEKSVPVATFISRPLRYGGYFTLQCWGKVNDVGGYVQLSTISDHEVGDAIQLFIMNPEWQHLQSGDVLYCPPNQSLMITVQTGILQDGAVMVDLLQVQKVGKADKSDIGKKIARNSKSGK